MGLSRSPSLAIGNGSITTVKIADLAVTFAKLGIQATFIGSTAGAPLFYLTIAATSGGSAGSGDDVTVFSANCPVKIRIIDSFFDVTLGAASSTSNLRTAAANGGSLVCGHASVIASRNRTTTSMTATAVIAVNGSLFLRRSDRSVTGQLFMLVAAEP